MEEEEDNVDGVDATSLLVISNGRCARAGLEGSMLICQPLWPWEDNDNDEEGQRRGNYTPKSGASSAQHHHPSVRAMERQWIPTTIETTECRTNQDTHLLFTINNQPVRPREGIFNALAEEVTDAPVLFHPERWAQLQ